MISMGGLAGVWGPAEGSVVSGVWAPAGASVNSASGRPSDNPSATPSDVLIWVSSLWGEAFIRIEHGALRPSCSTKPYYAHRRCRCIARFRPAWRRLGVIRVGWTLGRAGRHVRYASDCDRIDVSG